MNDKCFCHLNGYAVKDATARLEIETIKETYATKEELNNIDVTQIDLTDYATKEYVNASIENIPETDLTDYATKEYVDGAVPTYTTLFEYNGDTNNFGADTVLSLNDTISNYDFVEIYYAHGELGHFTKSIAVDGLTVCLTSDAPGDSVIYQSHIKMKFEGSTVKNSGGAYVEHRNSSDGKSDHKFYENIGNFKIRKIIGIKL